MIQEIGVEDALRHLDERPLEPAAAAVRLRELLDATPAAQRRLRAELLRRAALTALDLDDARRGLALARRAVRLAITVGDPTLEGRCRTALVRALMFVDRLAPALAETRRAAPLLRGAELGSLHAQHAIVLYKMGDHAAALEQVNAGLRLLPVDSLEGARALNNRGLLRLYLGGFSRGLADLSAARDWYLRSGMAFAAAEVRTNVGMMLDRLGNVPGAIGELAGAEQELRAVGAPVNRDIVYRAEVLIAARLFDEVLAILPAAVAELDDAGMRSDAAEGRFYIAQAMVLAGADGAAAEARAARQALTRGKRWGWAALAQLVEMHARLDAGERTATAHRSARNTALALQRAGLTIQEREAWLLAGRFALRIGRRTDAAEHWSRLVQRGSRAVSPAERLLSVEARARLAALVGDEAGTLRACHAGLTLIETHVLSLGATDLRVSASDHGTDFARMGLAVAWRRRDPRLLHRWVERWRAAALWVAPVRPPPDDELGDLLSELRAASLAQREAALDDDPATDPMAVRARVANLERRIQTVSRRRTTAGQSTVERRVRLAELHRALGDRALVEFVQHADRIGAVVLAGGRTTFHDLGMLRPVAGRADVYRFALTRLARMGGRATSDVAVRSASEQINELGLVLGAPLRRRLGDRDVVVVPDLAVHHLPWRQILSNGNPTTVAPSASLWHRAASSPLRERQHVVVVAGPGLTGAADEARRIAALHPAPTLLTGAAATVETLTTALDGARIAHLAAHGIVRRDNPLFSSIELADGPINVHDLERVAHPPALIVLASCSSAAATLNAGNDVIGLAAPLLARGTRLVVAATVALPDVEIVDVMVGFHARLATGTAPVEALAAAAADAPNERVRLLAENALVCYGAH